MMALGMPIVGQSLYNNSENMYQYPYFKEQFAYNDPALIIQKTVELLNNPEKLSQLAEANAHTFDTNFTPESITARILERFI
jgi:glycosyltransferase involved in cell wall biosynthesis